MKNSSNGFSETSSSSENVPTEKYLTFYLENQLFAFKSANVVEIIRFQPITFVPKLPAFIKGVINLRGKIVTLIDLRLKLGKPAAEYSDQTSIIVSESGPFTVGFIVDKVNDVSDISESQVSESPKLARDSGNRCVSGIANLGSHVALVLDVPQLLDETGSGIGSAEAAPENGATEP
jgi:purine-binding chemotaxis protein CheW